MFFLGYLVTSINNFNLVFFEEGGVIIFGAAGDEELLILYKFKGRDFSVFVWECGVVVGSFGGFRGRKFGAFVFVGVFWFWVVEFIV